MTVTVISLYGMQLAHSYSMIYMDTKVCLLTTAAIENHKT